MSAKLPEINPDVQLARLLDQKSFDEYRREADRRRRAISTEQWHMLRAKAKRDLFFLNYSVLNYNRLSPNLHGNVCRHIEENADWRFRIYLLPRNHFKTRIITIGYSIQHVLPYTEEDRQHDPITKPLPYPANLGTDCRVLITHESQGGASRYLVSITAHFMANPAMMMLFPECIPSKNKQRINKNELELPRTGIYDEPTFDTLGVGARSQGRHYNIIFLDDIYGVEARDSDAVDISTKDWFDNIQAFFTEFTKDKWIMPGTRYRFDDVYGHAMEVYGDQVLVYRRSVEEINPKTGKKEPIFPEEVTTESLNIIKKNAKVYESQFLNDPSQSGSGFEAEWERFFYWKSMNHIAVFDGETESPLINVRDMDICILIDPGEATGGFVVTGADYLFRIFTLVALPIQMKPPQLVELIFKSVMRWQPRTVSIEGDALQNVYIHWLQREMAVRGVRFHITEFRTKQRAKDMRIDGLSNYYEAGRIFHNEKQDELRREFRHYGKSKNIHILDALAQGVEIWRPGWAPGTRTEIHEAEEEYQEDRDVETGYSAIYM